MRFAGGKTYYCSDITMSLNQWSRKGKKLKPFYFNGIHKHSEEFIFGRAQLIKDICAPGSEM